MEEQLIDPKQYRQLFLDDGAVAFKQGVTQTVHPPKKHGPLIRGGVQSRSSPQWNPEKELWEWWYMGQHIHYATSRDGEDWLLPNLGLYEWEGSKDNNIACPPGRGEDRLYHVLRDEGDPDPQRRYKGLLGVSGRRPAFSPDGFS